MTTKRRNLLKASLGAIAIAAFSPRARAQSRPKRIAFLWNGKETDPVLSQRVATFKSSMRELAYNEGRDYVVEQRFADNDLARLPALAKGLVDAKVDLIVGGGNQTVRAARDATREIPILTTVSAEGLATSLSRPGGNVTGLTSLSSDLYPKRVELLRQIVPTLQRVGILNDVMAEPVVQTLQALIVKLGLQPIVASIGKDDVAGAFASLQRLQAQGLIVPQTSSLIALKSSITQRAASHRLPSVYPLSVFVDAGGLASLSTNILDLYRRLPVYVDKIFKGAKPGDLPIEQPTRFELIVNLRTAKALGLSIPQTVLLQADKVIE